MDAFSRDQFMALANHEGAPCITICIPTHSSGVEVNEKQDAILFKTKLQEARALMAEKGFDTALIDRVLQPGTDMLKNEGFWRSQLQGLAMFMADGFHKIIKLPKKVKETLIVNSCFFLAPVLEIMADRSLFYLLVLSRKNAKLYEGDQYQMREIEVEGLPNGMEDVIHYEEKSGQQLFRKGGTSPSGEASYHGHGPGIADDTEYVNKYLKEVDHTLWTEILGRQQAPLLLSGGDYIVASYKQVSRYKFIWEDALVGNFEYDDKNTLYKKAKEKLEPYFKENADKALKNYYNNSTTELTSSIAEDVIPASFYAQISDLFVEKDQHIWGKFNEKDNTLVIHDEEQDGDECLINKAIIKTIMNGGDVHVLEKEKMPADSKIAAFLRFSL